MPGDTFMSPQLPARGLQHAGEEGMGLTHQGTAQGFLGEGFLFQPPFPAGGNLLQREEQQQHPGKQQPLFTASNPVIPVTGQPEPARDFHRAQGGTHSACGNSSKHAAAARLLSLIPSYKRQQHTQRSSALILRRLRRRLHVARAHLSWSRSQLLALPAGLGSNNSSSSTSPTCQSPATHTPSTAPGQPSIFSTLKSPRVLLQLTRILAEQVNLSVTWQLGDVVLTERKAISQ